jgi:hypothetical protein
MIEATIFARGTRVQLTSASHAIELRADTGTIVGPDPQNDGYYIVRLDQPALYLQADGSTTELREIVQFADNMRAVAP